MELTATQKKIESPRARGVSGARSTVRGSGTVRRGAARRCEQSAVRGSGARASRAIRSEAQNAARSRARVVFSETLREEEINVNENLIYVLLPSARNAPLPHARNTRLQTTHSSPLLPKTSPADTAPSGALPSGASPPLIKFNLSARGAELLFLAFVVGKNNEKYLFETSARHTAPCTKSLFHLRAAMFDSSYVYHKGNIEVEKNSVKSDAALHCKTLLLGESARGTMIPSLEIKENDVKAAHSASLGKIGKELLFYFSSRGIDKKSAQKLIIRGFFEEQILTVPDENLQEIIRKKIYERL